MEAAQNPGDELWDPSWVESAGERTIQRQSGVTDPAITLFCSWFCPFAQRAWIALEEKAVKYHYIEINPYEVRYLDEDDSFSSSQVALTFT
jgi:hypothetical protein